MPDPKTDSHTFKYLTGTFCIIPRTLNKLNNEWLNHYNKSRFPYPVINFSQFIEPELMKTVLCKKGLTLVLVSNLPPNFLKWCTFFWEKKKNCLIKYWYIDYSMIL